MNSITNETDAVLDFYDAETDAWYNETEARAILESRYPALELISEEIPEPVILRPSIPETWTERFILRRLGLAVVGIVSEISEMAKGKAANV